MTGIIERAEEIENKLYFMLKDIWDNEAFITNILSIAKNISQREVIIECINRGCTDTDQLHIIALALKYKKYKID